MSRATLHGQLLEQAMHLATRDRHRPRMANLRRAVSSAYYGLFHLLVHEATCRFLPARPADTRTLALRRTLARSLAHKEMKNTSRLFAGLSSHWPPWLAPLLGSRGSVPLAIRSLARTFVLLQEARHEADYDISRAFTRQEVRLLIDEARTAERGWRKGARTQEIATLYLYALVLPALSQFQKCAPAP